MSKKRRNRKCTPTSWYGDRFWQSSNFNQRTYLKNLGWIRDLAINRFRWVGLPDTCNVRYLETMLLQNGIATIAHPDGKDIMWLSLQATYTNDIDMYGEPVKWKALGIDGRTNFACTRENAVICFENSSFDNPWNGIELLARKLTHYDRTEDINLSHQQTPWLLTAPQERRQELVNVFKQIAGGETAILADDHFRDGMDISVIKTDVPLVVDELQKGKNNIWLEVYRYLGIDHLAFQKGERMIEDEANGNRKPTAVKLLDSLSARRKCCDELNERFGLDVHVYANDDWESYNWAYEHDERSLDENGGRI